MAGPVVTGVNEVNRNLGRLAGELSRSRQRAVEQTGVELVEDLRRTAPVDTGELRGSVHGPEVSGGLAVVLIEARHAKAAAAVHPFVRAAEQDARGRLAQVSADEVAKVLARG